MQLRVATAAMVFTGSYLPLALILLVRDFETRFLNAPLCLNLWSVGSNCSLPFSHPTLSISILAVCLFCLVVTLVILRAIPTKRTISIHSSKYVPAEIMNYTLPYVVSFMAYGYQDEGAFVGILIFMVWIFWITYKSGQIILNPVLVAFGWRLYEIEFSFANDRGRHLGTVLAKGLVASGDKLSMNEVQDVMIVKRTREGDVIGGS